MRHIDYKGTPVPPTCEDCKAPLPLMVLNTRAGHYVGTFCPNCGPYSRDTGYMSREEAKRTLTTMLAAEM